MLLFDEADAIFGKRSEVRDAHDRYANIESAYLLQRMESFDGLAVLATNLRANLDEAFTRRLDLVVDFPVPDAALRRALWDRTLGDRIPRSPDLDLDFCAAVLRARRRQHPLRRRRGRLPRRPRRPSRHDRRRRRGDLPGVPQARAGSPWRPSSGRTSRGCADLFSPGPSGEGPARRGTRRCTHGSAGRRCTGSGPDGPPWSATGGRRRWRHAPGADTATRTSPTSAGTRTAGPTCAPPRSRRRRAPAACTRARSPPAAVVGRPRRPQARRPPPPPPPPAWAPPPRTGPPPDEQKKGVRVEVDPLELRVEPGGPPASTTVTVVNKGSLVDDFHVTVNGPVARFAQVHPPVLHVFPGEHQTAQVRFAVPRAPHPAAGRYAFQVVARAHVHADVVGPGGRRPDRGPVRRDGRVDRARDDPRPRAREPPASPSPTRATARSTCGSRWPTSRAS